MLFATIMAGGSGTRLWPESRSQTPKQFLTFQDKQSMLLRTFLRIQPLIPAKQTLLIANQRFQTRISTEIPSELHPCFLWEPQGKNTAPCIAWAAQFLLEKDPDATMLVLPADHWIEPETVFLETVRKAAAFVDKNPEILLTFGVKPTYPATGYGYIETDCVSTKRPFSLSETNPFKPVLSFHEKPSEKDALQMISTGQYFWNAGIFVWKAAAILKELIRFEPEIVSSVQKIVQAQNSSNAQKILESTFTAMKSVSIDKAVLEKTDRIFVLPVDFQWDDLGTWSAFERLFCEKKDSQGNLCFGEKTLFYHSQNNLVRNHSQRSVRSTLPEQNSFSKPTELPNKNCPPDQNNHPPFEHSFNQNNPSCPNNFCDQINSSNINSQAGQNINQTALSDSNHLTTSTSFVSKKDHSIVLAGVHDLIVIQTETATLIISKEEEKKIPEILKLLDESER